MTTVPIDIDPGVPLTGAPETGHNRWHWAVPAVATCASGDELQIPTRDALDGQLCRSSTSASIAEVDVGRIHPLTGPVWVDDAEPGDLLEVEVLDVATSDYGFTSQRPGLGLLQRDFTEPYLVHWEIEGEHARSEQLPGVTITGDPFLGIVGVAPSAALIASSIAEGGGSTTPPVETRSAIPATHSVRSEGLRTGPPRQNGGNLDVKLLTRGARLFLPVFERGALLSVGDAHFAQGDGEVCGTAIETRALSRLRVTVRKAGLDMSRRPMPYIEHSNPPPPAGPSLTVLGHPSAGEPDRLLSAAAHAVRQLCDRIAEGYGYPLAAAYALCSVATDLRITQLVNQPNVAVSATIPLGVFADRGECMRTQDAR